jgi:hypothetical protein
MLMFLTYSTVFLTLPTLKRDRGECGWKCVCFDARTLAVVINESFDEVLALMCFASHRAFCERASIELWPQHVSKFYCSLLRV